MGKRISDEIINQIPILYNELNNKSEVARQLNISVGTVNKYLTVLNGAPQEVKKKKRVKITDEVIKQINEEYKNLKNMKKVAEKIGVSAATVKKYLSEENLTLSKTVNDDWDALWYYVYRLFGHYDEEHPVNPWNITQMMKFKNQGMPYRGQLLTLKYFYEVKGGDIKKSKGSVGIIPYIFSDAAMYYAQKEKEQEQMAVAIKEQLERDRTEIKYNPSDYKGRKKKKKKEIDLDSILG